MEEQLNFNYTDSLTSTTSKQYMSEQHDHVVELTGRRCYIFLLDKEKTEKSEIYNEAKEGRIYLPHFEERAIYKTNIFSGSLNIQNYTEAEENLEFEFNFERMVKNIRWLKDQISGNLFIKNKTQRPIYIDISKGKFNVKSSTGSDLISLRLDEYSDINFLINDAKKQCSVLEIRYEGNSEAASFVSNKNEKLYPRRTSKIEVADSVYQNVSDVIENGSIILTDKYKAYQVVGGYPTNDSFGTNYISWTCQCNTINLATIDGLPNDYREIIEANRYSNSKVKTE